MNGIMGTGTPTTPFQIIGSQDENGDTYNYVVYDIKTNRRLGIVWNAGTKRNHEWRREGGGLADSYRTMNKAAYALWVESKDGMCR